MSYFEPTPAATEAPQPAAPRHHPDAIDRPRRSAKPREFLVPSIEAASKWKPKHPKPTPYQEATQAAVSFCQFFDYLFAGAAQSVNNDPDIMTWDEAMASPYRD